MPSPNGHTLIGHGPEKVLVMHNWMATHRSFQPVWPLLDQQRFTYAFMDHRGYGLSMHIAGDYTAQEAATDGLRLATELGWQRFHVMGHSMSGMVAQRLAANAPDRVKSLIAVTPVPASGVPLDAAGQALFSSAIGDDGDWKTIAHMITGNRLTPLWHESNLHEFRSQVNPAAATGFLRMWSATDFHREVKQLPVPVLAVVGRHDFPAFGPEAIQGTLGAWFPNFTLEVLEGSGHHPMAEEPIRFITVAEQFFSHHAGN
ncbi:MAG: alpha/beta hydrolase [Bryobacterales bacterium]|nr:alpha/beta hydrolase [Bryobacterales bacterium]